MRTGLKQEQEKNIADYKELKLGDFPNERMEEYFIGRIWKN